MLTRMTWVRLARGRRGLEALQSVLILGAAFVVVVGVKRVYTDHAEPQAKAGVAEALGTEGAGGSGGKSGKDGTAAKNPGGAGGNGADGGAPSKDLARGLREQFGVKSDTAADSDNPLGTKFSGMGHGILTAVQESKSAANGQQWSRAVSSGANDSGGVSYGTYQLTKASGNAAKFAKDYYPDDFKDDKGVPLKPGTPEFAAAWDKVAAREGAKFARNEYQYLLKENYNRLSNQIKKDASLQLDLGARGEGLRQVAFSTATQFGPTKAPGVFSDAILPLLKNDKGQVVRTVADLTDAQIIKALGDERTKRFPGTAGRYKKETEAALDWPE